MTPNFNPVTHPAGPAAWSPRETRLALLAILAAWAIAAAAWPLTGAVVPWDSKNHFYPMLRYLSAALEHGELPLWNPYHFSGHPAVADPAVAALHTLDAAFRLARAPNPRWSCSTSSSSRTFCPAPSPSCRCSSGGAGTRPAP